MGAKVGRFFIEAGKAAAKGITSFVGNKVPILGPIVADKLNSMYAKGGKVIALADGGVVPAGFKKLVVNTPAQLLAVVKQNPDIAEKVGLTLDDVKEGIAQSKAGEVVVAKKRGGKLKKELKGESSVMVRTGGGGHGVGSFAKGGVVGSVF